MKTISFQVPNRDATDMMNGIKDCGYQPYIDTAPHDFTTVMKLLEKVKIQAEITSSDDGIQVLIRTNPSSYYFITQGVLFTFGKNGELLTLENQRR